MRQFFIELGKPHSGLFGPKTFKNNFMTPFFGGGSATSRLQKHNKEAVQISNTKSLVNFFDLSHHDFMQKNQK